MQDSSRTDVRLYRDGDEQSISKVIHDNFPNTLAPANIVETWLWQFKNRFSSSPPMAVAEVGNEIVAQYALMRFPLNYQGATIGGAISTATVTDKRFRGKGLFTRLAESLYQAVEKDGCKIVFGFPNSQSIRGFVSRLDWFELCPFPFHLRIVDFYPLTRKYLGDNILSKIAGKICAITSKGFFCRQEKIGGDYVIELISPSSLPDGMDGIWKENSISERIGVTRNSQYLKWRYLEKPFFTYEIYTTSKDGQLCGFFVIYLAEKFGLKTIYVMECTATGDSQQIYSAILDKLDDIAYARKADSISMLLLQNHPQYKLFRRRGFIRIPRKILPQKIYFAAKVLSKDVDVSYVKNPKNWYISWGDLDVV